MNHTTNFSRYKSRAAGLIVMSFKQKTILFCLLFLMCSDTAYPCGKCMSAIIWIVFPPILIWAYIGMIWFFLSLIFNLIWKQNPYAKKIPKFLFGLFLLFSGYVFSGMMGPVSTLPFLIFCIIEFIRFAMKTKDTNHSTVNRTVCFSTGILSVSAVVVTGCLELLQPTPRSEVDIIIRWQGTYPARKMFEGLIKKEPLSATGYRAIIKNAGSYEASRAAERLAKIGDPCIDVDLIINALDVAQKKSGYYGYDKKRLEKALGEISKIPMPEAAPASLWKEKWHKKKGDMGCK